METEGQSVIGGQLMKILIIDYGVGNHQSVANALKFLGYDVVLSANPDALVEADVFILPGVGAFGEAMWNLQRLGFVDMLRQQVLVEKKPILGICLGMQILADYSEEGGKHEGLGLIPGGVLKIQSRAKLPVPQVGWNNIAINIRAPLFNRLDPDPNFFFDHSYHFVCDKSLVSATCWYGEEITAAVQLGNIFGVQFHPEKSQNNGLKLFRSFVSFFEHERHQGG